ncbi:MAG: NMD3-related protein [archaeon]|nr:NMD3-related protein [archaeon]
MKNFCPNCGKATKKLFKAFCEDCFLKFNEVLSVPKEIVIETCKQCMRIKFKGKMFAQSKELIEELLESLSKIKQLQKPVLSFNISPNDDGTSIAEVSVSGLIDGEELKTKKETLLKPHLFTCDDCMKLSSNYYEAIMQIRFDKTFSETKQIQLMKDINKFLKALQETDQLSGIVKQGKVPGGIDLHVGSKRAGKIVSEKIARQFKSKVFPTYTLVGLNKKGKRYYRSTFLVRIN